MRGSWLRTVRCATVGTTLAVLVVMGASSQVDAQSRPVSGPGAAHELARGASAGGWAVSRPPARRAVAMRSRGASTAADGTVTARVDVRATRARARVGLQLREVSPTGAAIGTSQTRAVLRDRRWHTLSVSRRPVRTDSSLSLSVTAPGAKPTRWSQVVRPASSIPGVPSSPGGAGAGVVAGTGVDTTDPAAPVASSMTWRSGASGAGVADGSLAAWRGSPVTIAGTWNDSVSSQQNQWTLQPGFELGSWTGDVDDAIGAIYSDRGETWEAAAQGAYDDRWRSSLQRLATLWTGHTGTMYIRFAHEFNGTWYPWSVSPADVPAFKAAWLRFRTLQQQIFPSSKLVFCPNADTTMGGLDWRAAFPGSAAVDVVSVDYYNQWPFVQTATAFGPSLTRLDSQGAPRGLERFRQFAEANGLPFAISEWASNASQGDSPAFMTGLHDWLVAHAGSGPGQVLYEIEFNVPGYDSNFQLFPSTTQPLAAARYAQLW